MNKQEAAQLLELIELAYPYVYKDMDNLRRRATVRMWAASFPRVPYPIIEECFNCYRLENRYPPTVADINEELRAFHARARQAADINRILENAEGEAHFRRLMAASAPGDPVFPEIAGEGHYPSL